MLWRETEGDPLLRKRAFQGLRKYQEATRPAPPPAAAPAAVAGQARLLHHGTENGRYPVVLIPSLINPPLILDLSEKRSLLRHMAATGQDAYLVDWGAPAPGDAAIDLADHVTERLLPLLRALPRPPILVGYCLGGTLALAAAALHGVRAVATIAAPWHFDGFPAADRDRIAALWRKAEPTCRQLGYVPMEVLQSGFWALDPQRTVRKYAAFADMAPGSDEEAAFLAVEDWANAGPPLTYAAARELFERLYAADATGKGHWTVGGRPVTPPSDGMSLTIASDTDRIVPAAVSPRTGRLLRTDLGHVGMIVGRRARQAVWEPLCEWVRANGG